jgi:hypothetical protein
MLIYVTGFYHLRKIRPFHFRHCSCKNKMNAQPFGIEYKDNIFVASSLI